MGRHKTESKAPAKGTTRPITEYFARPVIDPPSSEDVSDHSEQESHHSEEEATSSKGKERKWLNAWTVAFSWLNRDPASRVVHCEVCRDAKTGTTWDIGFGGGVTVWKKDTFSKHATSQSHVDAATAPVLRENFKRSVQKSVELAKAITRAKLVIMRNILWTVQKELSITVAASAHNLMQSQLTGLNTLQEKPIINSDSLNQLLNPTHTSNFSTYEFLRAMNDLVVKKNNDDLKAARAFACHLDESTDMSHTKIILLYTQHINSETRMPTVTFRAALKLDRADAESIVKTITKFFTDNGIDMQKMVMLTSDGAAVMVGTHNGVAARFRRDIPHLISFHCAAHVQALAIKDVTKMQKHESFMGIERTLNELIVFLSTHNHTLGLESLAGAMDLRFTHLLKWIDIRWLSRSHSVTSVRKNLPVIQAYLEDASNKFPTAEGLHKYISSIDFLVKLHALDEILELLNRLNLMFQDKLVHPLDIEELTETVCEMLQRKVVDGDIWRLKSMKILRQRLDSDGPDRLTYKFKLPRRRDSNETEADFIERMENNAIDDLKSYTSDIIESLRARLEKNKDEENVLKASKIFDPESYRNITDDEEFEQSGKRSLRYLRKMYGEPFGIDTEQVKNEFTILKSQAMNPKKKNMAATWREATSTCLMPKNDTKLPNLKILAEIILCFNASNAEVERGFSLMNRIKTYTRNRLKSETLDTLMRLRLAAESYKIFNYPAAYAIWLQKPRYLVAGAPKTKRRRKVDNVANQNPESDEEDNNLPPSSPLPSADDNNNSDVEFESNFSGFTNRSRSPSPNGFVDVIDAYDEYALQD